VKSQTVNGANAVNLQYDQDGFLTRVGGLTVKRDSANGLFVQDSLGNITSRIAYSGLGEVTHVEVRHVANPLFQVDYARDSLGRIAVLTEAILGQTVVLAYMYDVAGRLVGVRRNDTTISTYTYDSNSNRVSFQSPGGAVTASYDAQDRLVQYGSATYTFTNNGDLVVRVEAADTTRYAYDSFGNLISVSLPNGTRIEYGIDGQNRRVGKRVNGALVRRWLYQNQLSPVAELDSSGILVARFVYGTRTNVPDYFVREGSVYRIISDHLGSPRLVVNASSGAVVQRLDYDEFGNVILDTNPGFQPFGYAGGLYDRDTKLVRFGARDYDPGTGRWTAKDPVGFWAGDFNLYNYVMGDPVNRKDPSGLLYLPPWHFLVSFWTARLQGFGVVPSLKIAWASVEIDFRDTQGTDPSSTAVHGMASPCQTAEQARQETGNYINIQLGLARDYALGRLGSNREEGYYRHLGYALHAAQDQWAGGHNYSTWLGEEYYKNKPIAAVPHFLMDAFPFRSQLIGSFLSGREVLRRSVSQAIGP
jgi:RHS repeat-associated protein